MSNCEQDGVSPARRWGRGRDVTAEREKVLGKPRVGRGLEKGAGADERRS